MSANPQRRRLLGLFAVAPLAAAAGAQPASALARVRTLAGAGRFEGLAPAAMARISDETRGAGLPGIGAALERAHPLDVETPSDLLELVTGLSTDPTGVLVQQGIEARTIAALAPAYPPEIAAYRSFGAPMRRRLYAELLTRESVRLATVSAPASPPPEDTP